MAMGKEDKVPQNSFNRAVSAPLCQAVKGVIAGLIIALSLFGAVPVAADPASPDVFSIISVKVFRHVYEEDDFLLVFHYDIHYDASPPSQPANKIYHFRLMSVDGLSTIGAAEPYAYNNSGYDEGCGSFYFAADDAPTWEDAYILRIDGNPMYWSSPPTPASRQLVDSDYSQLSTRAENRSLLGNYILQSIATSLEIDWGIKMIDESDAGTVLSTTGETYFKGTIPGIKDMCPQIFNTYVMTPTITDEAVGTSLLYTWEHQWDDTWVENALTRLGDLFGGIPWKQVAAAPLLVLAVVAAGFSQVKWGTTDPGFWGAMFIFNMGMVAGIMDWGVMGVGALVQVLYIMYVIFWRQG